MDDLEIYQKTKDHTLLGMDDGKLQKLLEMSRCVQNIEGCVVEVGVYTGGSAKLLALDNPNRSIHLFDTFTGIPYNSGPNDLHDKGDFDADEKQVRSYLSDCSNVRFHVGIFPDTWPKDGSIKNIALAHCDVDMQRSAEDFIHIIYPLVTINGVIIFDDYNAYACPGVKKVVDKFIEQSNEHDFHVNSTQGILFKRKK